MTGERAQLYKIRRLVKRADGLGERYEWYDFPNAKWVNDQIDGFGFVAYQQAMSICERMKTRNKDSSVLYHSVVPV